MRRAGFLGRVWRHPIGRYAAALVLTVFSALLRELADPLLTDSVPFILFYPALIVSGLFGGLGPGVLSLAVSAALSTNLFPWGSLDPRRAADLLSLGIYVVVCGSILWLTESSRRARARLETELGRHQELLDELHAAAADRQRQELDRRLLASIVSSSEDAIVSKDLEGRITSWNRAAERMFGYTKAEAIGQSIALILPEDRPDDFRKILDQIRQGRRVERYETRRRRKDGVILDVSLTVSPIRDESGRIVGASKIAHDITAAKAASEELRRTRDLFLGMLGHDLRNPLNAIVSSLYVLERQAGPAARPASARVLRAADRMGRMIGQLLDFTRARLGAEIPVTPAAGDLALICAGVVEELEALHPRRVALSSAGPIPGFWDSDRLAQVVSNLVWNALEHGAADAPVKVHVSASEDEALIEVGNRGKPIPPEEIVRIFDPFSRASSPRASRGVGLGLYIVREIVQAHGGAIEVASDDLCTRFSVMLPRRIATAARERA